MPLTPAPRLGRLILRLAVPVLLVASLSASPARAQWRLNGEGLCSAASYQFEPQMIADGAGGAIVTWLDLRGDSGLDESWKIYAQRVDAAGVLQWDPAGVACGGSNAGFPSIISDGAGGAIVLWQDGNAPVRAQHLDATGALQWAPAGVAVTTPAAEPGYATIAPDGAGGAIVTWRDSRGGGGIGDIYAQRISALGLPQWATDGVVLCAFAGDQLNPAIVRDGVGGAIVAWQDYRSNSNYDVYAQRVSAAGAPQWTPDGVALCTSAGHQTYPMIVSDGSGGAIAGWHDLRSGVSDVFARRINAAGAPQWTAGGVALCTTPGERGNLSMVADGVGGAIASWADSRTAPWDIYAQRVNSAGTLQWSAAGAAVCTATDFQVRPAITSDGAGGAIVTWEDYRVGGYAHPYGDLYAQRLNGTGVPQWPANGMVVGAAPETQQQPCIVTDGAGGAILTWEDDRSNVQAYAGRVNPAGYLVAVNGRPNPPRSLELSAPYPNPATTGCSLDLKLAAETTVRGDVFDVAGRHVSTLLDGQTLAAGGHRVHWDGREASGRRAEPGLYDLRISIGQTMATRRIVVIR